MCPGDGSSPALLAISAIASIALENNLRLHFYITLVPDSARIRRIPTIAGGQPALVRLGLSGTQTCCQHMFSSAQTCL